MLKQAQNPECSCIHIYTRKCICTCGTRSQVICLNANWHNHILRTATTSNRMHSKCSGQKRYHEATAKEWMDTCNFSWGGTVTLATQRCCFFRCAWYLSKRLMTRCCVTDVVVTTALKKCFCNKWIPRFYIFVIVQTNKLYFPNFRSPR